MSLIEDLNWRYACKQMNNKEVDIEKIDTILEAIRLAPTSMGLQAFKVLLITDKALKEKIFAEAATRQKMIPDCSHLLVFAAYTKITETDVDNYMQLIADTRNVSVESLSSFKDAHKDILAMTDMEKTNWTSRQTYIAMAYATVAAANLKVDATPIEGFNIHAINKILDLPSKNLTATLLLPLGYKDEEKDYLVKAKKVRKDAKDIFIY
jgi:nitroreductase/dihydropteridine reductase